MCVSRGMVSQYAGVLLHFVRLQALAPGSFSCTERLRMLAERTLKFRRQHGHGRCLVPEAARLCTRACV